MPTDAFEMALVHQAFRNELHNAAGLIRDVNGRDTNRAAIVGGHVDFIATALHHHHAAEDEVIWPKLRERAATREVDITRMEDTHRDIADDIARVRKIASVGRFGRSSTGPATRGRRRATLGPGGRAPRGRRAQHRSAHQHPTLTRRMARPNHRHASRGVAKGDTAHAVTGSSHLAPLVYRFDRVQVGFET